MKDINSSEVARKAIAAGYEEAVAILYKSHSYYLKIANSKIDSIVESTNDSGALFVSKAKHIALSNIESPTEKGVKDALSRLSLSIKMSKPKEDYFGIAQGPFKYKGKEHYDKAISNIDEAKIADIAEKGINAALSAGAQTVGGTVYVAFASRDLYTSRGCHSAERFTEIRMTERTMSKTSSYQNTAGSNVLNGINPARIGRKAAEMATSATTFGQIKDGLYDVIYMPMPAGSLLRDVNDAACSTELETGSFLADKLGKEIASKNLTIYDDGASPKIISSSICDEEGYPSQRTAVIDGGVFKSALHNNSTAKKYKTNSTGNAGLVAPQQNTACIEFKKTLKDVDKLISSVDKGILVTNLWYTRYKNYLTGEFSTVPRDLTLYIENGKPKFVIRQKNVSAIVGIRVSDSIPRMLKNIQKAADDTVQITNWEDDNRYYVSPSLLVSGVRVTAV